MKLPDVKFGFRLDLFLERHKQPNSPLSMCQAKFLALSKLWLIKIFYFRIAASVINFTKSVKIENQCINLKLRRRRSLILAQGWSVCDKPGEQHKIKLNPERVRLEEDPFQGWIHSFIMVPRFSSCSNRGLKLANAFGVFIKISN